MTSSPQIFGLSVKGFTHAARHEDEVTSRFEWTRTDALFIISVTTAFIWDLAAPGAEGEPFKRRDVAVAGPKLTTGHKRGRT